ncbi:MAG: hypothetical protein ACO1RT_15030 [Planctomycetaceae bacterium]
MLLIPLIFIWSRAPMKYGIPARTAILATFVLGVTTISIRSQLPGLESLVVAADNWDEELAPQTNEPPKSTTRARLREGTRIAPSIGRFSRSGRRWIFEQEAPSPQNEGGKPAAVVRAEELGPASPDAARSADPQRDSALPADAPPDSAALQLRVLENLALQRVSDAIAQDSNDVRWIVTGIVTEFSGENWLLLSTVFRAPSTPGSTKHSAADAPTLATAPSSGDSAAITPL